MDNFFRKEVLDAPLYTLSVEKGIKLNQNESPWDLPMSLKVSIIERLVQTDFNRYPLEDPIALKKQLAKYYGVMVDQIVMANGTNVLIQALVNATSHQNKVLLVDPTFSVYEIQAKLFGNTVIKVPLNDDFSLPVERMIRTIKQEQPSLVFIPNPNAPTGNLFDKQSLHRIISAANCLVVIDEAYYPFSHETVIEWLGEFHNLVILRTFSKAFALAGARFGFALCDSEVSHNLEKVLLPFCVSRLTCAVIEEILKKTKFMDQYVKDLNKERDRLLAQMQEIQQIKVFNSHANYILFKVENASIVFQKLLKQGVIVRNVSDDSFLKDCLRVTVGTADENKAFIKALQKVYAS